MNTTSLVAAFVALVSGLIWIGMDSNSADWTGNRNQCVGECYEQWKADNEGGIAGMEQVKQAALAAASPKALGEKYFGQCIACHGGRGEGGIGPMLAGQAAADIAEKLTGYRAGQERGAQSAMMYPVAKPMSDSDISNLAAYVASL
jgi:cytochrome c553